MKYYHVTYPTNDTSKGVYHLDGKKDRNFTTLCGESASVSTSQPEIFTPCTECHILDAQGDYRIRPADGRSSERVSLPDDAKPEEAIARAQELSALHGFPFIAERWHTRNREHVCISPGFRKARR